MTNTIGTGEQPEWAKQVLAKVPGIQMEPIPHSVLPPPFQDYCLTTWIRSDIPILVDMVNHPATSQSFGWPMNNGVAIESDMVVWLGEGGDHRDHHFPLTILRRIDSLDQPAPRPLARYKLAPDPFRVWGDRAPDLNEANLSLPEEDRRYQFAPVSEPSIRGKGISTAALKHQFAICPWLHKRGQLSGGWLVGNEPSRRLQLKLGFEPVGRLDKYFKGRDMVLALWTGRGEATKEESAYAGLDDLGDIDVGPYIFD